jgi:peptidoglycan hydrolase-like protein with peptidoglycan-binding domain/multidrug efflux pump subunit AcrA (membrane-fusion protein)
MKEWGPRISTLWEREGIGPQSAPTTSRRRIVLLFGVLALVAVAAVGGWIAGNWIESPAEVAARTAPPTASPILVPVEERVLSSNVVTRGTARFGLPQPIAIAPSVLKGNAAGLITTLPRRNTQLAEGDTLLTASGRPVFVLQGRLPAYRDLVPSLVGEDVRQLEEGLQRIGHDPGPVDGVYDASTSHAVASWYRSGGWEPFGPTLEQRAKVQALEVQLGEALKNRLASAAAASAASLAVDAARATAEHNNRVATAELAARVADKARLVAAPGGGDPLAVESERARAKHAESAAEAELAATIADRALIVLDPRQPETARQAAEARLELAKAAAEKTGLEGELAVQAAERDAKLAAERLAMAEAAVESARLAGQLEVQAAVDQQKVAQLVAQLAADLAARLEAELEIARSKLGVQVPVDELVFIPALPARVEELSARVGDEARGTVLSVTDNQLAIDSSLPLDAAPLVKPGMVVRIDEQALGIEATGVVQFVAESPGTRGVDGFHIYFEVRVDEVPMRLEGYSVRLTIPIESTAGAVTAVPLSALSLAADGTSRIQVRNNGVLQYLTVEPGMSADGFVEVTPVSGELAPGQLVVVGFENPEDTAFE